VPRTDSGFGINRPSGTVEPTLSRTPFLDNFRFADNSDVTAGYQTELIGPVIISPVLTRFCGNRFLPWKSIIGAGADSTLSTSKNKLR
jgi:hypothetical protein